MNDAKCKRGLRVPSASITLVATSVFSTKGGQVAARLCNHSSSVAWPFSRLRHRQRGQTGLRHPCLLNKACALAALHAHTHRRDMFVYPSVSRSDVSCVGVFGWRPLASSLRWCGAAAPPPLRASPTLLTGCKRSSMCRRSSAGPPSPRSVLFGAD